MPWVFGREICVFMVFLLGYLKHRSLPLVEMTWRGGSLPEDGDELEKRIYI
jgi:hypothetical protein